MLSAALAVSLCATASASILPQPMRDAVDQYATGYAGVQGWEYIDRLSDAHGDYRRAYFRLQFGADYPTRVCDTTGCTAGPPLSWSWIVEARAARCGPGWYVISTPLDRNTCHTLWPSRTAYQGRENPSRSRSSSTPTTGRSQTPRR